MFPALAKVLVGLFPRLFGFFYLLFRYCMGRKLGFLRVLQRAAHRAGLSFLQICCQKPSLLRDKAFVFPFILLAFFLEQKQGLPYPFLLLPFLFFTG